MRLTKIRSGIRTAALSLLAVLAVAQDANADSSVEYAVKGAYLYKMLPFVDWPPSAFSAPNSPIMICILGRDPFGAALDKAVADQRVGTHPIAVRRNAGPGDTSCQVAFVGIADPRVESNTLHAFDGRPVLTVTDSGAAQAGIICFVVENNHVRFDIDDAAAMRDGLAISSKLLDLAHAVKLGRPAP